MTQTILHIDASARVQGSVTRDLTSTIVAKLGGTVIRRDLKDGLPLINETWINANFTPADARTDLQKDALSLSDTLIEEIKSADVLVLGIPMYNFAAPAAFKAWIDLVCRAGETFQYSEAGPKGLMEGKRAVIAVATGGVPAGSDYDFTSNYLRHIMGFIGITDVEIIAADRIMAESETAIANAKSKIEDLAA